jgi:CBS domain-containing protein
VKAPVLMNKYKIKRLPVVDKQGRLQGIITKANVCEALFNGKEKH